MMSVAKTRIAGKHFLGPDNCVKLGKGVELATIYTAHAMRTRIAFIDKIHDLRTFLSETKILEALRRDDLPLCTADITLSGKVQKVNLNAVAKRLAKEVIEKGDGIIGDVTEDEDGDLKMLLSTDPISLLCFMEYFRENRGYQVVIGRKGGGESGNWIIEEQGRDVPADSHAVFLPRINNANYSIKFIGENLDTSFTEIFTRETFLKFGWPNLITSFHDDLKTHGMNAGGLPGLIAEKVK